MLKFAAIMTACAVLMVAPVFAGMAAHPVSANDHTECNEPAPVTIQQLHDNENKIIVDTPNLEQQHGMKFADPAVRDCYCFKRPGKPNPITICQLP